MKKCMGSSQFNRLLAVFNTQAKASRDTLQELLEDGFLFAQHPKDKGHGDLSRLTKIIHVCQQTKGLPTRTVQRYIQAFVDCKWCKLSDGTMGFKFNGAPDVAFPNVTYYDWRGNTEKNAKPDVDLVKSLKSMLTRAKTAQKKGGKVEHEELLPEIEKILRNVNKEGEAA